VGGVGVGVVCILFLGAVGETKDERGERELLRSGWYVCERWGGVCAVGVTFFD
jgi:hypothetical protein